jgi:uncharacterized protein
MPIDRSVSGQRPRSLGRNAFPGGSDVTTEQRQQQEPSMEEILSSIRRIIADEEADHGQDDHDDDLGAAEASAESLDDDTGAMADAAEDDQEDDVLELTRVVRESGEVVDFHTERPAAAAAAEDAAPMRATDDRDQALGVAESAPLHQRQDEPEPEDEPVATEQARITELMSTSAATVATGAFAKLSQVLQRTPQEASVADHSGRSVEQFVEDIVRPMLKDWLDEHLTAIVERLVEKEIQKIARRAELN